MTNEFDEIDMDEKVPTTSNANDFDATSSGDDLIDSGSPGKVYDWSKAPEGVKAPPRINMDGVKTTLKKTEIVLPPKDRPWQKTRKGDKEYKYCSFVVYYDHEGQQEFYSGVRVFKREGDKYSNPTITRDRVNQVSGLLGMYADYKKKNINEVSLKEFMSFMNSKPEVIVKIVATRNPTTGDIVNKNLINSFV